jgi:hypothetical protein
MIFDTKTLPEIYDSILAEVAKASAEIRCAKNDLAQAETRMKFVIATMHYLRNNDLKGK